MNLTRSISIVAVVALVTVIIRAFPFILFGRKEKQHEIVAYLGKMLPPAIMATLVVYCYRNIKLFSGNYGVPELVSGLIVVVLHLWKRNILISILGGTICYMFLLQFVF